MSLLKLSKYSLMLGVAFSLLPTTICAQGSIRELMDKYYDSDEFIVGASSKTEYLKPEAEKRLEQWLKEFSYNTPENDFKQSVVYATPNSKWNNDNYMSYIDIARKNGQVVRAHGPISPQCSRWIKEDSRSAKDMEKMLKSFMKMQAQDLERNADVVKWMDVVNETFSGSRQKGIGYDASLPTDSKIYLAEDWFGPRKGVKNWENPWTVMGFETVTVNDETFEIPRYIEMAFSIAQKYAPSIKKIYNEHGKTINPEQWRKIQRNVHYLRSKGLKVDGLGWQGHVELGWEKNPENIKNLVDLITWCHDNDLEFHLTELDVTVSGGKKAIDKVALQSTREQQAATLGAVVEVLLQNLDNGVRSLNFWTMTERFGGGRTFATLFTEEGEPTPAYFKIKDLLVEYGEKKRN